MHESRAPTLRATYRLQLHAGFTLRDATAVVPYLDELGISHVYASPIPETREPHIAALVTRAGLECMCHPNCTGTPFAHGKL